MGLLGAACRAFALVLVTLESAWGVLMALLCFWVASNGSVVRGILATGFALTLVTACALIIAVFFACLTVVRKAVADVGLGRAIFNALFEHALGVSGDDPGQDLSQAKIPTHLSKQEVEKVLKDAAKLILAEQGPGSLWSRPFFWLAKQIERISIWATIKVIVKSCSHDGQSVNMFELRDRLASTIDNGVVNFLRQYLVRLAMGLIFFASAVALLIAFGISYLPF